MASGAQGGGNGWDLLRHSAPETDRKTRWFSNRRSKSEKQRSFAGTARRRPGTDETYFNAFIVTLHEIGEAYTFPLTERCRSYERLELSVPGDLPGELSLQWKVANIVPITGEGISYSRHMCLHLRAA